MCTSPWSTKNSQHSLLKNDFRSHQYSVHTFVPLFLLQRQTLVFHSNRWDSLGAWTHSGCPRLYPSPPSFFLVSFSPLVAAAEAFPEAASPGAMSRMACIIKWGGAGALRKRWAREGAKRGTAWIRHESFDNNTWKACCPHMRLKEACLGH